MLDKKDKNISDNGCLKSSDHNEAAKDITIPAMEYEELKKKVLERDDYHNKWKSVLAEYENTRRRMERERINHIRFANEEIIARLFPIVDNFDMALDAIENAENKEALMDGIKIAQREFHKILDENGIERIKTDGAQFDPNFHEAISVVETKDMPENTVVSEIRPGYLLNGRLLRPAQVKVSKHME